MGVTRLIAEGRRLMFPSDRKLPDHKKRLTIASEVISYRVPDKSAPELEVAYVRVFCNPAWRFRVVAIDIATARELGSTVARTWDEAVEYLEQHLRDQLLIASHENTLTATETGKAN